MRFVWDRICDVYRAMFTWIELEHFTDPTSPNATFPELSGKAGEKRHLLPVLLGAFRELKNDTGYEHHADFY